MKYFAKKEQMAYSKASFISGQALTAIRTIVAFGGEEKEFERYTNELHKAEEVGIRKSMAVGGGLCTVYYCCFIIIIRGIITR